LLEARMKKTGAWLLRYALEQVGIRHTFGIPGVHTTELYDELGASESLLPLLVTHEGGGAFMADAISRLGDDIGTLVVVPAAGLTHAASGIGEAFLDGVPMLVISGGIRTDVPFRYQLHDIDQQALMRPLTKGCWKVTAHRDLVQTVFDAVNLALDGEPGPVYVEIPLNIAAFAGEIDNLPVYRGERRLAAPDEARIKAAAEVLRRARRPAIFAGWGARGCGESLQRLADLLGAPVATTLQGLSVFPGNHPLHAGFSFGPHAVPAASNALRDCDCLLAIGTRFAEIPTGSYGVRVPEDLVHVDINPEVFDANYPAKVAVEGDAMQVVQALLAELAGHVPPAETAAVKARIAADKRHYVEEWLAHDSGRRVNPARFFGALRGALPDDAIVVADDGNHTFLTAELLPIHSVGGFLSPTDFNCMGYCVPACIGAKLVRRHAVVAGICGDGAFLMTCMELVTAATQGLGLVIFVFNDGELSQIAQAQEIPYNRKTCSVLGKVRIEGIALATGAEYLALQTDADIDRVVGEAFNRAADGKPVIVDVNIDYSKRTRFTKGVVTTNLRRFGFGTQLRFVGRALARRITG
jgi:acetolactate synthase-1/2/3 large subunit